jgi:ribokinase
MALAMLVCSLGDLTLDVIVRLAGPIAPGGDTNAEIRIGPGGQAANVAAWAAELGAAARFVGKTGADDAGELVRERLSAFGVEIVGPVEGRNGSICSLVSPGGDRSMAADRGSARELRPDELEPAWFAGCTHLHVSGYALMVEPVRSAALRAAGLARGDGARISLDLASWSAIRDSGVERFRDAARALTPEVVFANDEEEQIVGHLDAAWIRKRGAAGCSFDGDERAALPVERVLDTTGAGDALAAGWIVGGPDLALDAAARCIQQLGAMPVASER